MVILPAYDKYAGLRQGLNNLASGAIGGFQNAQSILLQKALADQARQQRMNDVEAFSRFLSEQQPDFIGPQSGYSPQSEFGANLYGDYVLQQSKQTSPQSLYGKLPGEYQYLTPEQQRSAALIDAGLVKEDKPITQSNLVARLGEKVAAGTATDGEKAIFERLTERAGTNVTVNTGGETVSAIPEQLENLSYGQELINQFKNNPNNKEILKNSDVNVVTNTKGQLQLEVKPKDAPAASQIKEISDLISLRNSVDTIDSLYKPDYVGIVNGNPLLASIKEQTGVGVDTQEVQFRRITNDLSDRLLRARSGAQINEQEYKRLLKIVPEPTLSPDAFKARLNSFRDDLDNVIDTKKEILEGTGNRPVSGVPKISGDADFDKLPSGTIFIGPDGKRRIKP